MEEFKRFIFGTSAFYHDPELMSNMEIILILVWNFVWKGRQPIFHSLQIYAFCCSLFIRKVEGEWKVLLHYLWKAEITKLYLFQHVPNSCIINFRPLEIFRITCWKFDARFVIVTRTNRFLLVSQVIKQPTKIFFKIW